MQFPAIGILNVCNSSGLDLRKLFCPFHPLNVFFFCSPLSGVLATCQLWLLHFWNGHGRWDLLSCLQQFPEAPWVLAPWHSGIWLLSAVTARSSSVVSSCFKSLSVVYFFCLSALNRWRLVSPASCPCELLCAHLKVLIFKIARLVLFYKLSLHVTIVR